MGKFMMMIIATVCLNVNFMTNCDSSSLLGMLQTSQHTYRKAIHDDDMVYFPDELGRVKQTQPESHVQQDTQNNKIPVEIAQRWNEIESIDDFVEQFIKNKNKYYEDNPVDLTSRGGITLPGKKKKSLKAEPAKCIPELTVVPLKPQDLKTDRIYFPTCTRINRCGGCCIYPTVCKPTDVNNITLTIIGYINNGEYKESEHITLEEHVSCHCGCSVKKEDCKSWHRYEARTCSCVCKPQFEENKNNCNPQLHIWDSRSCSCRCREEFTCSSGAYFNNNMCRCAKK